MGGRWMPAAIRRPAAAGGFRGERINLPVQCGTERPIGEGGPDVSGSFVNAGPVDENRGGADAPERISSLLRFFPPPCRSEQTQQAYAK